MPLINNRQEKYAFRFTFIRLFTICLQIRLFFMQKAAIKVKDRDSGYCFDFFAVLLPCGFIVP